MTPLKISVSGIRGVVGETFTPHIAVQFSQAFGTYLQGGAVMVGRDTRPSGEMVRSAVLSGLLATGCTVTDAGICTTPSLQLAIAHGRAEGGVAITAGHNAEDWNALKFIRGDGLYLGEHEGDEVLDIFHEGEFLKAPWNGLHPLRTTKTVADTHLKAILALVDRARLRRAKLRVALDAGNGACSDIAPALLQKLGCRVIPLNTDPGAPFPHTPEPTPDNMRQLRALVTATGCDVGFLFDSAGERLGIVTEEGVALPEDSTLPLCALLELPRSDGPIVTNLSSSRVVDDVAKQFGRTVVRTPIGQAHVSEAARKFRAAIAGEGSGGVILPRIQYTHDGLAAMALVLDGLAARRTRVSRLAAELPTYVMRKKKVPQDYTKIFSAIQRARVEASVRFRDARLTLTDGIKLDWKDGWLHVRPSNTEPLIRIIAEARTERRAEALMAVGEELIG
jgi:phosphomannomutase